MQDLVQQATITATSELLLTELPMSNLVKPLDASVAQMLPLKKGKVEDFIFYVDAQEATSLEIELRVSSKPSNHTPDVVVVNKLLALNAGKNTVNVSFDAVIENEAYAFVTFIKNPKIDLYYSDKRVTGILSVFNSINKAVSNYGKQTPPEDIGVEAFEFWCPKRRKEGHNIAFNYEGGIDAFKASNVSNGIDRPVSAPNAWVADWNDAKPALHISWTEEKTINQIDLLLDTDYDHPMESVLMGHPENVMPFCVRNYVIKDGKGNVVFEKKDNYQTINRIKFEQPLSTNKLTIEVEHPSNEVPAAIFSVRCY